MGDQFSAEQKAELISMYTGMAMQGLTDSGMDNAGIAREAVAIAVLTVHALESYHYARAAAERAERHAKIDSSDFSAKPDLTLVN
jgi:hypothetical protein